MESLFNIVGMAAGLVGIWMTYWNYVSSKRLEIFQVYTEKFNAIITPEDTQWWSMAMRDEPIPAALQNHAEHKMLQYLNLVWEEFYLHSERLISRKLWQLWLPNVVFVLNTEFCQQVFTQHEQEFGPKFREWVYLTVSYNSVIED